MTASIGIWAQGDAGGELVVYHWEADQRSGFVTFEVAARRFRPAEGSGQPIGDLVYDAAAGESSGVTDGVDRRLFNQVVAAILRGYAKAGAAPVTAHAHFY